MNECSVHEVFPPVKMKRKNQQTMEQAYTVQAPTRKPKSESMKQMQGFKVYTSIVLD